MDLASRLGASMLVIAADSMNKTEEVTEGSYVYGHLVTMQGQLQEAKDGLVERVRGVLVGVEGSVREGWRLVKREEVVDVGRRVREVMGMEMKVVERLRGRLRGRITLEEGEVEGGGVIELSDADVEYLGLPRVSGDM